MQYQALATDAFIIERRADSVCDRAVEVASFAFPIHGHGEPWAERTVA
jgi:hypothetical protein